MPYFWSHVVLTLLECNRSGVNCGRHLWACEARRFTRTCVFLWSTLNFSNFAWAAALSEWLLVWTNSLFQQVTFLYRDCWHSFGAWLKCLWTLPKKHWLCLICYLHQNNYSCSVPSPSYGSADSFIETKKISLFFDFLMCPLDLLFESVVCISNTILLLRLDASTLRYLVPTEVPDTTDDLWRDWIENWTCGPNGLVWKSLWVQSIRALEQVTIPSNLVIADKCGSVRRGDTATLFPLL